MPEFTFTGVYTTDSKTRHYLEGQLHCASGPAVIYKYGPSWWYILGRQLSYEESNLAKEILSDLLMTKIPLYINHPLLKYFCQEALSGSPIHHTERTPMPNYCEHPGCTQTLDPTSGNQPLCPEHRVNPTKVPRTWWIGFLGVGKTQIVLDEHPGELSIHFKELVHVQEIP